MASLTILAATGSAAQQLLRHTTTLSTSSQAIAATASKDWFIAAAIGGAMRLRYRAQPAPLPATPDRPPGGAAPRADQ